MQLGKEYLEFIRFEDNEQFRENAKRSYVLAMSAYATNMLKIG